MICLKDYKQYNLCKDIFFRYVQQFKFKTLSDYDFFLYHRELLKQQPELTNYAYQFALYASFDNTKIFSTKDLEKAFNNTFKVKDVYHMNGYTCDITTLNSAIIFDSMRNQGFFTKIPIILVNIPLEYGTSLYKSTQAHACVKTFINQSFSQTGQTNCDALIGDRCYDIKHMQESTTIHNHILPWTYEQISFKGSQHMANILHNLRKNNNRYAQEMASELQDILKNTNISINQKINIWNTYLSNNWMDLEKHDIKIPIIIQMTSTSFVPITPKRLMEKVHVDSDTLECAEAARKSIAAVLLTMGPLYMENATKATNGIINSTLIQHNIEEID